MNLQQNAANPADMPAPIKPAAGVYSNAGAVTGGFFVAGLLLGLGNTWTVQLESVANAALISAVLLGIFSIGINRAGFGVRTGEVVLWALFAAYIFTSVHFNEPTIGGNGEIYINNANWWMNYGKMGFAAMAAGTFSLTRRNAAALLLGFCTSGFLLVLIFAACTYAATGAAVCGTLHNVLDGTVVNTAGLMSLLVFLPCLAAGWAFMHSFRGPALLAVVPVYLVATAVGYLYASRTVFVTLWMVVPALLAIFSWRGLVRNTAKALLVSLAIALAVLLLVQYLKRPINFEILRDARFTMYLSSFIEQVVRDPFQHAHVDRVLVAEGKLYIWFHNFFADAHRLSGFWCLLSATGMILYIGVRIVMAAIVSDEGKVLLMLFIVTSLILCTSVVPEGEFQPILLVLILGGCAEGIHRRRSFLRGADAAGQCPVQ